MRVIHKTIPAAILNDAWVINLRSTSKMEIVKNIFNSGVNFFLIGFGIMAFCQSIKLIVEMCSKKKEAKIRCNPNIYGDKLFITEQEYVDNKFDKVKRQIEILQEEIKLLKILNTKEYKFIKDLEGFYVTDDVYVMGDKARKWAKENGYSYIKSFESNGELWVKESKQS